jgi:predicted nicotinamide N-methyase
VDFIRTHTRLQPVPFVPELRMHTATDVIALWESTESAEQSEMAPPFWAFPWAGGQAVARYVLDHPETVTGRAVLDLASGSGLVAMAAALAGAESVVANEIDRYADAAIAANALANSLAVTRRLGDLLDAPARVADVILAGDVFYSRSMAGRMLRFMQRARSAGVEVFAGDPGRAYVPRDALEQVAEYRIPVIRDLEDADTKLVTVWRVR